jgi:hypothetical protein
MSNDRKIILKLILAEREKWLARATDLLAESLDAWEGEEDSVKEEHEEHIAALNKFFYEYNRRLTP